MGVNVVPTLIYSSMMGMMMCALVNACLKPRCRQTNFLILLLMLLLFHILGELYIYTDVYRYMPELAGVQFPIRVLLGPALYFYAVATMSPGGAIPKRAYAIATLGPLLVILAMLPFAIGLSSEEKLALAHSLTRNPDNFKLANEDIDKTKVNLKDQDYHVQLPRDIVKNVIKYTKEEYKKGPESRKVVLTTFSLMS